jgi:hypothetical protein
MAPGNLSMLKGYPRHNEAKILLAYNPQQAEWIAEN